MTDTKTAPYAALLLRLTTGILFLTHASLKIFVFTPAGTAQFFESIGLPAALAYITMVWEVAGGLALILGIWPRLVALALTGDGALALKPGLPFGKTSAVATQRA